jgi:hypothetical protein
MIPEPEQFESILLAELRLGLPPLFYWQLKEIKDDWAFILKLHALFEGALTKLLVEKLALREIKHERLTLYDSFVSRVQLAERLKLVLPEYKKYLLALNRLRNHITHNIRFINLQLSKYYDSLTESDFRRAARELGIGFENILLDAPQGAKILSNIGISKLLKLRSPKYTPKTGRELFMCLSPKTTIWFGGIHVLHWISLGFHQEVVGKSIRQEPEMWAKLQDLLLDPKVTDFIKKLKEDNKRFFGDD